MAGNDNSLLWRVSGNGLSAPSYLYGTMHSKDERVFHFADSVMNCFERCSGFAMELVFDETTTGEVMSGILLDSSETLRNVFSASQYDSLNIYCKKHLGTDLLSFEKVKPVYLMFLLQPESGGGHVAEKGNEFFLDEFLQHRAEQQLKKVYTLEKTADQLNVFNSLSISEQVNLLMNSIRQPGNEDSLEFEQMINAYTGNELSKLNATMESTQMPEKFFDLLYTSRNKSMANKIDSLSHIQPVFFAFGAAHLAGSKGVIALLRQKGFTVEPVMPTYNSYQANGWYAYTARDKSYSAVFPSIPALNKVKVKEKVVADCVEAKSMKYDYKLYSCLIKKGSPLLTLNDFLKLEYPALTNFKALKTKTEKETSTTFSTYAEVVYSRGEDNRTFITFQNDLRYFVLVIREIREPDGMEKNKFLSSIKINPS